MKLPQKILFLILATSSSLIFVGIGVSYYYWRQLTQLPDWYSTQSHQSASTAPPLTPAELQKQQLTLRHKLQTQIQAQVPKAIFPRDFLTNSSSSSLLGLPVTLPKTEKAIALQLDSSDLQQVLLTRIAQNPQTQPLLSATQGFKTTITPQTVTIGTVVNSQKLLESLSDSPTDQKIQQLLRRFPPFKNQNLAIQLEGTPRVEQGKLILDKNSVLTVGTVRFSVLELAQKLGVTPSQIQQYLTPNSHFTHLNGLQLQDNQLTLEIAPVPAKGDN